MGEIHRWRRRTWVDGEGFGTEKEAAQKAGVSISSVCEALKAGGRTVKGRMISGTPPETDAMPSPAPSRRAGVLIRYPPGEGPLYIGLKVWR